MLALPKTGQRALLNIRRRLVKVQNPSQKALCFEHNIHDYILK